MAEMGPTLIEWGLGVVTTITTAIIGAVWKQQEKMADANEAHHNDLWDAVNEHRKEMATHKESIARDYITRTDFNRLEAKIDKLSDFLHGGRS
jgi:hypothetical protein